MWLKPQQKMQSISIHYLYNDILSYYFKFHLGFNSLYYLRMPTFYVYILECLDKKRRKSYYTGYTQDLKKRFNQHCEGKGARYTKGKALTIKYHEMFTTRSEAMQRELEIKKLSKKQKRDLIFKNEENNSANT